MSLFISILKFFVILFIISTAIWIITIVILANSVPKTVANPGKTSFVSEADSGLKINFPQIYPNPSFMANFQTGSTLFKNQYVQLGNFYLVLTEKETGELSVYSSTDFTYSNFIWRAFVLPNKPPMLSANRVVLTNTNELVVYREDQSVGWSSGSNSLELCELKITDAGVLQIVSESGVIVWDAKSSPQKQSETGDTIQYFKAIYQ